MFEGRHWVSDHKQSPCVGSRHMGIRQKRAISSSGLKMKFLPHQITHPAAGWKGIGLLGIMILPFLMGVFLFEKLTGNILESALEKARDVLPIYAKRMEEAGKPSSFLSSAISREIHEDFSTDVANQSIPDYMEKLKKALGVPARFYLFDKTGRLVFPLDGIPEKAEWETFYQAIEHHLFRRPITPESQKKDLAFRKFARQRFGMANWRDFVEGQRLIWECKNPPEPPKYVGLIRWKLFENPVPQDIFHVSLYVEVSSNDVPDRLKNESCLGQLPDEVACAAIAGSETVFQVKVNHGRTPSESFFLGGKLNEVEMQNGFFLYKRILEPETGRVLCLAIPFPLPASIPFSLRLLFETIFLVFLAVRGQKLVEILLGCRRLEVNLGRQIFLSFLFAALVPLVSLTFLGTARLIESNDLQTARWKTRMVRALTTLDRKFFNWIESLQLSCQEFAVALSANPTLPLTRDQIPQPLAEFNSIAYSDAESVNYPTRLYSGQDNRVTLEFARNKDQMKKVMVDFLQQFLSERGQLPASAPGASRGPALTVQDILGENNPLLNMIKNMNQVTYSEFNQNRLGSFCQLIETAAGKIRGLMLLIFDLTIEGYRFLNREEQELKQEKSPFTLLAVQPDNPTFDFPGFGRIDASQFVQGTRETQKPEHFILTTETNQEYLATTYFPRYLLGRYPILAVPTAPIKREREYLVASIILFFCLGIGTILLVSRLLWRNIVLPVRDLREGARQITAGNYQHRLSPATSDELGSLAGAFNRMAGWLQERERMKRFVSESIVSDVRKQAPEDGELAIGRKVEAAILFSDIRGFTTLSESHSADELVQLLNDYFSIMDLIIKQEGGEIQKLIGDAIMAVFHLVPELDHPALRAAKAGFAMRNALKQFNQRRREMGLFTIENGIGIHFDQVVEGKIGAIGGRLDFTVMGPALGLAQTLESFSKDGEFSKVILSSQAFREVSPHFSCVPLTSRENAAWEIAAPIVEVSND